MPYQVSPISALCGFPLRVTRVRPRAEHGEPVDFDQDPNKEDPWVYWMMMDPPSGLTPPEWLDDVGPVVVWRPDGAVSRQDMRLFNGFLADVRDMYSDHVPTIRRYNPDSDGYFVPVCTKYMCFHVCTLALQCPEL